MNKSNYGNDKGFTLVELMVVVAIIGILSAVAIPQFQTYQAKSRTAEAKIQLSALYQAEISLMSDYDNFGSCLAFAGFTRPAGQYYYAIGFTTDVDTTNAYIRANGGVNCLDTQASSFAATKQVGGVVTPVSSMPASTLTANTFTACAAGAVDSGNTAAGTVSQFTVNQDKTFTNPTRGY